jgi:hypothetical protein
VGASINGRRDRDCRGVTVPVVAGLPACEHPGILGGVAVEVRAVAVILERLAEFEQPGGVADLIFGPDVGELRECDRGGAAGWRSGRRFG